MVVMALDHTRDFFHTYTFNFSVEDPLTTSLPIFLTRWITHYCAPIFCFLAGVSAFLVGIRKSKNGLSSFLFKRGVWLIFIELSIVCFGWRFSFDFNEFYLLVIWSLGVSMVVLSGLVQLPMKFILTFSLILIFGHNTLDNIHFDENPIWKVLHDGGEFKLGNISFFAGYPVIPWIAVMALGYCFGTFYQKSFEASKRTKTLNLLGIGCIILFLILRSFNIYGNEKDWVLYPSISQDIISFLNPEKYPPSLLYLLMTLGPALIFMANSENLKGRLVDFFSTFGRVPFFYYMLHLYLIHLTALVSSQFYPAGFRLWMVYVIWIFIILVLYPICKRFDQYKSNHSEKWWLSYL